MTLSPSPNWLLEPEPFLSPQLKNPIKKKKKFKKKSKKIKVESQENLDYSTQLQLQVARSSSSSPPRKRTKSPGVRVRGGRIFDSENGKTCHQCRQKTMDVVALCKSQIDGKLCTIKFCHKCLSNRYGENAEEANQLDDWKCPKCREICNCSFCMKKKGHQPTGILVHAAKATGFRSVLDMLIVNGPENVGVFRKKKIKACKRKALVNINTDGNVFEGRKGDGTQSKRRTKKAHLSSGLDLNLLVDEEDKIMEWMDGGENMFIVQHDKLKKMSRDDVFKGRKNEDTQSKRTHLGSEIDLNISVNEDETTTERVDGYENTTKTRPNKLKELARAMEYINYWGNETQLENYTDGTNNVNQKHRPVLACGMNGERDNFEDKPKPMASYELKSELDADISMPWDNELATVSDLKLPDIEDVLQFLEFCNSFGEELLSKELPDVKVVEPAPCVPLEMLASLCNFAHMIS